MSGRKKWVQLSMDEKALDEFIKLRDKVGKTTSALLLEMVKDYG